MKHYYLIKQWFPHKGQTPETPSCYFCGGYVYSHPLTSVKRDGYYTSKARAEREAAKNATLYSHTEVIEIPCELIAG